MLTLAMGFGNPTEIAIIGGVVILLFGGAKIAGFGRSLGQGISEFKKATTDEPEDEQKGLSTVAAPIAISPVSVSPADKRTIEPVKTGSAEMPVRRVVQRSKKGRSSL